MESGPDAPSDEPSPEMLGWSLFEGKWIASPSLAATESEVAARARSAEEEAPKARHFSKGEGPLTPT